MNTDIILTGMTAQAFVEMLRPVFQEELKKLKDIEDEVLLSPADTCKLFQPKISRITLDSWAKQGKLQKHKIGRKTYYKRSEVIASLTKLQRYKR